MFFEKLTFDGFLIYFFILQSMHCSNITTTRPACHPGILVLFNWCEQSDCQSSCSCTTNKVCKQICEQRQCGSLYCNSTSTCHQSVLTSPYIRRPKVVSMLSISPITQQDCSDGHCDTLSAIKYKNKKTKVFQSCSGGRCGVLKSNAHQVKQFCDNCGKLLCYGKTPGNCTQLCIIGNCNKVKCTSTNCKQLCSHGSHCNLECSKNVETCRQECIHGSTCNFNCRAKSCTLICDEHSKCTYSNNTTTKITSTLKPTSVFRNVNKTTSIKIISTKKATTTSTKTVTSPLTTTTAASSSSSSITVSSTTLSNEVELPGGNHVEDFETDIVLRNNSIVSATNFRYSLSSGQNIRENSIITILSILLSFLATWLF